MSMTANFPGAALLGLSARNTGEMIQALHEGMPTSAIDRLARALETTPDGAAQLVGLSARTWARRKAQGRLTLQEGERAARLARVIECVHATSGQQAGNGWLRCRLPTLGMRTPLEYLEVDVGEQAVMDLLAAFEHGHFV